MNSYRRVAQSALVIFLAAALILALVLVFREVSRGPGAAPAATASSASGYPASGETPAASETPAPTQSGYPGPAATLSGVPSPTSILDTIGFTPTPALAPLNDAPDQFDPKTYGLPDTIAGYKVLGVITPKNEACVMGGRNTLVLQTTDPTVQDYLKNSRPSDIIKAMTDLGLNTTEWNYSIAGPGSTRQQLIAGAQAWNQDMEKNGCVYGGGPAIPAVTPTPQNS
jgi:hypothetical protein